MTAGLTFGILANEKRRSPAKVYVSFREQHPKGIIAFSSDDCKEEIAMAEEIWRQRRNNLEYSS